MFHVYNDAYYSASKKDMIHVFQLATTVQKRECEVI